MRMHQMAMLCELAEGTALQVILGPAGLSQDDCRGCAGSAALPPAAFWHAHVP